MYLFLGQTVKVMLHRVFLLTLTHCGLKRCRFFVNVYVYFGSIFIFFPLTFGLNGFHWKLNIKILNPLVRRNPPLHCPCVCAQHGANNTAIYTLSELERLQKHNTETV